MGLDTFIHTLKFSKSIWFCSLEWILYYDVGIKIVSVAHSYKANTWEENVMVKGLHEESYSHALSSIPKPWPKS